MADFFAGMAVFAGVLVAFASLTRAKFETIDQASARQRAQAVAEERVDDIRRRGAVKIPKIDADKDGFSPVSRETPEVAGLAEVAVEVDARSLNVVGASSQGLLEVRVRVRWTDLTGKSALDVSTTAKRAP